MLILSTKKGMNPQGEAILRNEAMHRITSAKFLGIIIVDQHLKWKKHISVVCAE